MVETHGRTETAALLGGLDRRWPRIEYRGVVLEEMDLDAVLARRPTIALVDELAHTNAPGMRHAKRYQDVEDLLRAGINVISTLNVQHLESLYDLVEQSTGVKVKDACPTTCWAWPIRLSTSICRRKTCASGCWRARSTRRSGCRRPWRTSSRRPICPGWPVGPGRDCHVLDRRREQGGEEEQSGPDRVMVCLGSRSPNAAALLRKAARIASRINAPWYAVYIQTPGEDPAHIEASVQRQVANNLELAHQFGGVPMTFKGAEVVSTIAAFVKEYAITLILLGRTQRPWYSRWFGQSVLDRLQRLVRGVDVLIADNF